MFPSVRIFVPLIYAVVDVLMYLPGSIAKKKPAQKRSAIAVANYVWARPSNFNRTIIVMAFCCFTPGSLLAYPLKVCSNKNENEPSGSLIGSYLKYALEA